MSVRSKKTILIWVDVLLIGFLAGVGTWAVMGQLREKPYNQDPDWRERADFLIPPMVAPRWLEITVGIAAITLCILLVVSLFKIGRDHNNIKELLILNAATILSGILIGSTLRIASAASSGANIGGVLALFTLPFLLAGIWGLVWYLNRSRSHRAKQQRPV